MNMSFTEKLIWNAAIDQVKTQLERCTHSYGNPYRHTSDDPLGLREKAVRPDEEHVLRGLEVAMREIERQRK